MLHALTQSSLLLKIPGLEHGFAYGPSGAELDSRVATVKQVHGDLMLWSDRWEKKSREADAIATLVPGLPVGVYSADCAPLLVAALSDRGEAVAVMAVHAGWRGTAKEIAKKSLGQFQREVDRLGARKFYVAIGPCISFESFEVGQEVIDAFPGCLERGLARFLRLEGEQKKYLFDLPGENARQVKDFAAHSGSTVELDTLDHCTLQQAQYPSFRRDREKAGRILSYLSFPA